MSKPTELVSEDYYKEEVVFEREINAQQNALDNNSKINIASSAEGIFIKLDTPDEVKGIDINLYRSNSEEDDINIESKGKNVFVESSKLKKGRYLLTADWSVQELNYQLRDTVWIH